jgi:hypothetical protein
MKQYVEPPITKQERKTLAEIDGHWCNAWDGLAVSAWTCEYDACDDFKKSRLGRVINRLVMIRFNFGWWLAIGRHGEPLCEDCAGLKIKSGTDLTNQ